MMRVMRLSHRFIARRTAALPLCLGISCLFVSAAALRADEPSTQPAPQTQPAVTADSMKRWFDQLADADPDVRDDATDKLMQLKRDDLPLLRSIVKAELPITPTQADLLPGIVGQIFLAGEDYQAEPGEGFMGIQKSGVNIAPSKGIADENDHPETSPAKGIWVVNCLAGFCGGRVLHPGDTIIGIKGTTSVGFASSDIFSDRIKALRPGATVHLQIVRHERLREVTVTLQPRPTAANSEDAILILVQQRQQIFDRYWAEQFAPLLKEEISSTEADAKAP